MNSKFKGCDFLFFCQTPRSLKQSDLEKVLSVSKSSRVVATEYSTRRQSELQSRSGSSSEYSDVRLSDFLKFIAMFGGSSHRVSPDP